MKTDGAAAEDVVFHFGDPVLLLGRLVVAAVSVALVWDGWGVAQMIALFAGGPVVTAHATGALVGFTALALIWASTVFGYLALSRRRRDA